MKRDFKTRYGPWALVAGASEGLGAAFAAELASRGLNLVLVARRAALLEALARKLTAQYGVRVSSLPLDLGREQAAQQLVRETAGLRMGLLVYNAAASFMGAFLQQSIPEQETTLNVNCRTPAALVRLLGKRFVRQRRGGILLMSSLTGFQGSPLLAHYGATKAYTTRLAEGLWWELRRHHVHVLVCCAGATATPGYLKARTSEKASLLLMAPPAVAREALNHLDKGPVFVPGLLNRLGSVVMRRLLPRPLAVGIMARAVQRSFQ